LINRFDQPILQPDLGFQLDFRTGPTLVGDGAATATHVIRIRRNVILRAFDLIVEAARASSTPAGAVAQVRESPDSGGRTFIIDFGTLRTVSGLAAPEGAVISTVFPWTGTGFSNTAVFSGGTLRLGSATNAFFQSEIRTERLLVTFTGSLTEGDLMEALLVQLPEAPAGLELRLASGAPFWTHPPAVTPGSGTALSIESWNSDSKRLVSAAPALAPLVGDPLDDTEIEVQAVLTSRVPGVLSLAESTRELFDVRRVLFGSDTSRDFEFPSEGRVDVPLQTKSAKPDILELRFTVLGNLPPDRVLPPVGPDASGLAEIVLASDRAALIRLVPATGLSELHGLRIPLTPGSSGAEVRVGLWSNQEAAVIQPLEALEFATTPVTLDPVPASAAEEWITFSFETPVPIEDQNPPWAAVLVSRGQVRLSLAASSGAQDPVHPCVLRTGPPAGPWQPLPGPLSSGAPGLGSSRGRIRMMGRPPKDKPLAPLLVELSTGATATPVPVTPTAKGAIVQLMINPPAAATAALRITSRVAGNITLRDIDIVSTHLDTGSS
jgi:hypothetical protein